MGYTVTLKGYKPAERFDGIKWTEAWVFEAPDAAGAPGAWAQIDAVALADYADPQDPPVFNLTTTNGTQPSQMWYRVEFHDPVGGIQDSAPEFYGTSAVPDVDWVRAVSDIQFAEYGYPAPAAGQEDRLQTKLDEAVAQFQSYTGIDGRTLADVDKRVPLVRLAHRMLVEYAVASASQEILDSAADYDMISSLTAGTYSESRRGPGAGRSAIHPWPALDRLLRGIIFFDQAGAATEGVGIDTPGLLPRPGAWAQPPWYVNGYDVGASGDWTYDFPPAGYPIVVPEV